MMQNYAKLDTGSRFSRLSSNDSSCSPESSGYSSQSMGSSTAPLPRHNISTRHSKLSSKAMEELFEFDEVFDTNDDEGK